MKVSVLIPTYKYARYLPEAIESVLSQDFGDFELIVSDDASNDGSAEIIRRYAEADPRVRAVVHERNLGMVRHWNWCLQQARGEYVKYVFGDDKLMSPGALGRMVAILDANPRVSLAVTARVILDSESRPVEIWDDLVRPGRWSGAEVFGLCLRRDRNLVGEPSAVMFRRADGARGFDPDWRQFVDMEMWFHLLLAGDLFYDPEALCAFRRHPQQQTVVNQKNNIATAECMQIVARYLDTYAEKAGLDADSMVLRRALFRFIYYVRKDRDRGADAEATAALLKERLTPRWYRICLLLHRASKPFGNLRRFFAKRITSRTAPKTSSTLIRRTQ